MLSRRAFAGLLAAALAVPRSSLGAAVARRSDEARSLRRFAEFTHPRGREAAADAAWRRAWGELSASADVLSDGEYFVRTRRALAWFGDGHTTVLPFEFTGGVPAALGNGPFSLTLPVRLRAFDDGIYVVGARDEAVDLLGGRLTRLGTVGAVELIRTVAAGWPGNAAWAQRWAGGVLGSPAQLQGLGLMARADLAVEVVVASGDAPQSVRLLPQRAAGREFRAVARTPREHEAWAASAGTGNYVRDLGEGVLYASIDEMDDVEGRRFDDLTRELLSAVQASGTRRLIVDLRRNGGGNNFVGEALRRGVARSRVNRPGGLYVLTGPQTFSAAQNLANRLERETFARFVGGPTGGAPNHYGDARPKVGAATGITAIVSSVPWFDSYPQDRRPWILPDLPVPDDGADWLAGRDPALELARGEPLDAPGDELAAERVYYFGRASQLQAWRPFWRR